MQPVFLMKKYISLHYAHNVFFKEVFCKISLALLKNGHLYFCPFSRSDAISFRRLYKRNIFNKGYKERRFPIVGYTMIPPHVSVYYSKNGVFGGFSMILLSRFSLFLKIIVKSKGKCSV